MLSSHVIKTPLNPAFGKKGVNKDIQLVVLVSAFSNLDSAERNCVRFLKFRLQNVIVSAFSNFDSAECNCVRFLKFRMQNVIVSAFSNLDCRT